MSLARKCDICGKFYEFYGDGEGPGKREPNTLILKFAGPPLSGKSATVSENDCCPECMREIERVLYNLGKTPDSSREKQPL